MTPVLSTTTCAASSTPNPRTWAPAAASPTHRKNKSMAWYPQAGGVTKSQNVARRDEPGVEPDAKASTTGDLQSAVKLDRYPV